MKNQEQALKELVIRSISDDYEDFERIIHDVAEWASATRESILRALEQAIAEGFAQAYILSTRAPARAVKYSPTQLDDLYFYVTHKGEQLAKQLQNDWT